MDTPTYPFEETSFMMAPYLLSQFYEQEQFFDKDKNFPQSASIFLNMTNIFCRPTFIQCVKAISLWNHSCVLEKYSCNKITTTKIQISRQN